MIVGKLNLLLNYVMSILKLSRNDNCIIRNGNKKYLNLFWYYCLVYFIISLFFNYNNFIIILVSVNIDYLVKY